jgi:carbon monoxide dehydrogenase subunit G
MAPTVAFHFERDVAASASDVAACLLDPTLLARCVPGASLTAADGNSVTGRIRIKQAAVPSVYRVQAELDRAEDSPGDQLEETVIAAGGVAEEQRTGRSFEFRIRVGLTPTGPGRSRFRIIAELPAGDDTQALLDRLSPQFIRRLEDVALERPEFVAAEGRLAAAQEPAQSAPETPARERWVKAGVAGAVSGVTAAAVLLAWSALRRWRSRAFPS